MNKLFDLIVIGAGPSAIATLSALPNNVTTAVITGETDNKTKILKLHPQIRTVAKKGFDNPGLANQLFFSNSKAGYLSNTAIVGGLANYWGKQFVHYEQNDPFPADCFNSYENYRKAVDKVKENFSCFPDIGNSNTPFLFGNYLAYKPCLLRGTKKQPQVGLNAMKKIFYSLATEKNIKIVPGFVQKLGMTDKALSVELSNGERIYANQVFLAAGVVGSLQLILASCQNANFARLKDHSPYMYYFLSRKGAIKKLCNKYQSDFNQLTVEEQKSEKVKLFASIYNLSNESIGLLLATLRLPPIMANVNMPKFFNVIKPIQIWTNESWSTYEISKEAKKAKIIKSSSMNVDKTLQRFENELKTQGHILQRKTTACGFGFHYHGGKISDDGDNFENAVDYIKNSFGNRLKIADATALPVIGVRPHTLTMMAYAYQIARKTFN